MSRATLQLLIDSIPDSQVANAERSLGALLEDPLLRALYTAPDDDEELSDDEIREIDEARTTMADGGISDEEVKRKLGL